MNVAPLSPWYSPRRRVRPLETRRGGGGFNGGRKTVQERQDVGQQGSPSFAEFAAALATLRQSNNSNNGGELVKWIATAVGAAAVAIGGWTLNSVNSMQQTLARVDTTVTSVQSSTTDMGRRVDVLVERQSEMAARQSALEQRVQSLENSGKR